MKIPDPGAGCSVGVDAAAAIAEKPGRPEAAKAAQKGVALYRGGQVRPKAWWTLVRRTR